MKRFLPYIYVTFLLFPAWLSGVSAQEKKEKLTPEAHSSSAMRYIIEGRDTVYVDDLPAARVYNRLPKQKGKDWRKYYRLVYNFSKVYMYTDVAKQLITEADSTIAADKLKGAKRDRYIDGIQREIFSSFGDAARGMTISQGALLMRLVDREIGKSPYFIIKYYKNGMAAGFWQGIAKIFGTDMKAGYDPEGEDRLTEELIQLWEKGEFDGLYYSLFWEYPTYPELPSKYR